VSDTVDTMSADPQYDLRRLFKAVGRVGGRGGENAAVERKDTDETVEVIDAHPLEITADPLEVTGFVDGIQSSMHLTHRERRPVVLYYVAAGALGEKATPVGLVEKLRILAAADDVEWVAGLDSSIPVEHLAGASPPEFELNALHAIGTARDQVERELVHLLLADRSHGSIVVDGSLTGRPKDRRIVGVVKSVRSRYLPDEKVVWNLPVGWRSPRFKIGDGGNSRFSCYLQLVDKGEAAWNLGLIRLEALDPDLLEPLAARCLAERQGARSGDARWDRHLASVRAVEEFLRARRPAAFSL
jgi:hypothetical protein